MNLNSISDKNVRHSLYYYLSLSLEILLYALATQAPQASQSVDLQKTRFKIKIILLLKYNKNVRK